MLNDPANMQPYNHDKIQQLILAHNIGFNIPKTAISNKWKYAYDYFNQNEVAMKLLNGTLYVDGDPHFLPTTIINSDRKNALANTSPFPGIFQEFIPKHREWRITVVGDKIFPVAVYVNEKVRNDWRKYQFSDKIVQFKSEELPTEIKQKCFAMLKQMNLRYGSFDLIESANGVFTFLEVNVNGQYQWLEDKLELGIAKSIGELLMKIRESNSNSSIL